MYKKQSIKLYKKLSNAKPFFLICGPCMIESEKITLNIAEKINNIKNTFNIPIIFKSSFDKANRTSGNSPRGVGIKEGLKILNYVNLQHIFHARLNQNLIMYFPNQTYFEFFYHHQFLINLFSKPILHHQGACKKTRQATIYPLMVRLP